MPSSHDMDDLFGTHIPAWYAIRAHETSGQQAPARSDGRPLPGVVYAVTFDKQGLGTAHGSTNQSATSPRELAGQHEVTQRANGSGSC